MQKQAKKFIDFIITQNCTYKCSYCSQSKNETKEKHNASNKTIDSFLNLIKTIDKDFEITITGGEALLHPRFFEIIEKIKLQGFKVNLITNFSFELEKYNQIFNILNNSLLNYDISFHLDEIKDFNSYLLKLEKFIILKPKTTKINFLIPIFKINKQKEEKIKQLIDFANKNNIKYHFQHIRILNKYKNNTQNESTFLKNTKKLKTFSKLCLAGKNSFVIYENGNAYRCYSSRFSKSNHLGNINDKNFKLNTCALPCTQKCCTCPKPAQYRQISDEKNFKKTLYLNFINYLFLPFYIIKNKNIIFAKLKQYKNLKKLH